MAPKKPTEPVSTAARLAIARDELAGIRAEIERLASARARAAAHGTEEDHTAAIEAHGNALLDHAPRIERLTATIPQLEQALAEEQHAERRAEAPTLNAAAERAYRELIARTDEYAELLGQLHAKRHQVAEQEERANSAARTARAHASSLGLPGPALPGCDLGLAAFAAMRGRLFKRFRVGMVIHEPWMRRPAERVDIALHEVRVALGHPPVNSPSYPPAEMLADLLADDCVGARYQARIDELNERARAQDAAGQARQRAREAAATAEHKSLLERAAGALGF